MKKQAFIVLLLAILLIGFVGWNYNKIEQEFKVYWNIPYFEVDDLCFSWTAIYYSIDNTPENIDIEKNLQALIDNILIPVRKEYGKYIKVNSGYRCTKLNKKVGGVPKSQHQKGEAVDITAGSIKRNKILYDIITKQGNYDQLIWENGGEWIHVSYKRIGKNRNKKFAL